MSKSMQKVLVLCFLFLMLFFYLFRPRSDERMKEIATEELNMMLTDTYRKYMKTYLKGPLIVKYSDKNYINFIWYHKLDWGDTAKIYVQVYRNPLSWDGLWTNITMNYQTAYLTSGKASDFKVILPDTSMAISAIKLAPNQGQDCVTCNFIIAPEKLLYILKNGYFEFLQKKDDYTKVAFYESIAKIYDIKKNKTDTIYTRTARIFIDKNLEVKIIPYHNPATTYE